MRRMSGCADCPNRGEEGTHTGQRHHHRFGGGGGGSGQCRRRAVSVAAVAVRVAVLGSGGGGGGDHQENYGDAGLERCPIFSWFGDSGQDRPLIR